MTTHHQKPEQTNLKSNCCTAPMKTSIADEGTGCWICEACSKPCDPKINTPCTCDGEEYHQREASCPKGEGQFATPLNTQQPKAKWEIEFDYLSNMDIPEDTCTPQNTLLITGDYGNGEEFLTFPENEYELDPDKVKKFIQTQIDQAYKQGFDYALGEIKSLECTKESHENLKAEARAEVVSKIVNLIAMARTQGKDTVTVVLLEHLVEDLASNQPQGESLRQEGGEL